MSRIEEAVAALKEGKATARRYVDEADRAFAFGVLCGAVDRAIRILEQQGQPAIPEGFTPYDGSGQPVAGDVVVKVVTRQESLGSYPDPSVATDFDWAHYGMALDIVAYRIIHDPSRLPDVPWEDYPEAKWATINMEGVKAKVVLWREGKLVYVERLRRWWPAEGAGRIHIATLSAGEVDMTYLDPARCKWERPRKSIDDATPEQWTQVAKVVTDDHALRMEVQALRRRVASLERSVKHLERN